MSVLCALTCQQNLPWACHTMQLLWGLPRVFTCVLQASSLKLIPGGCCRGRAARGSADGGAAVLQQRRRRRSAACVAVQAPAAAPRTHPGCARLASQVPAGRGS